MCGDPVVAGKRWLIPSLWGAIPRRCEIIPHQDGNNAVFRRLGPVFCPLGGASRQHSADEVQVAKMLELKFIQVPAIGQLKAS